MQREQSVSYIKLPVSYPNQTVAFYFDLKTSNFKVHINIYIDLPLNHFKIKQHYTCSVFMCLRYTVYNCCKQQADSQHWSVAETFDLLLKSGETEHLIS